jgi:hypothetical protein
MRSDQYIEVVRAKCDALTRSGLWLPSPKLRPDAWLNNFHGQDKIVAAVLLDHFVFFSSSAVDRMLLSAYRALTDGVSRRLGAQAAHKIFAEAVFTSIEGEDPNVTDSGNLFCRKLRQTLSLDDQRFAPPIEAVEAALNGRTVIFLDDMLGSGTQFLRTWNRGYRKAAPYSFNDIAVTSGIRAYYLTLIATRKGYERLSTDVPDVVVAATHIIDDSDSVRGIPKTGVLPEISDLAEAVDQLITAVGLRLPPYLNTPALRKLGHDELGLLIAFDHSTPDSTLPIFWGEGDENWTPLVRRV